MKVWFIMVAVILILSGCGTTQSAKAPVHEKAKTTEVSGQAKTKKANEGNEQKGKSKGNEQAQTKTNEKGTATTSTKQDKEADDQPKPEYRLAKNNYIKPIGDANPKVVLLTIDDGPAKYSVGMAETLKKLNAKAIFYVMGVYIDSQEGQAKLKQIHQMGFTIGDHTRTHPHLPDLSNAEQTDQILSVYKRINSTLGQPPKFFRAPFGENTDVSRALAAKYHMLDMNWSYGYDWNKQYENPKALANIMVNSPYLANGAILLMHDRSWTSEALPDIVKGLRAKGYQILDPALLQTP